MAIPAKSGPSRGNVLESVLIAGDLAMLSEQERVNYYMRVCESLGLNPLTRPFAFQKFQGQTILYARKDCTDQLRRLHKISLKLVGQSIENDILTAHAQASLPEVIVPGTVRERTDEDVGSVFFPDSLKGENRANAIMKATTKAKRRVTLSICGLGMLDESELGNDQPERTPQAPAPNVLVSPPSPPPASPSAAGAPASPQPPLSEGAGALSLEDMAREAAKKGEAIFQVFWNNRPVEERAALAPLAVELRQLMDGAE